MAQRRYVFKVRTASGGIVGNIVYQGTSQPDAESQLERRYPGCTVLDVQVS